MPGKRVGILIEFNYEDIELWYPFYRLKEEGHESLPSAPRKGKLTTRSMDTRVRPSFRIDALIILGGFAPDYWRRDQRILDLVREMDKARKVLASVCHEPWVLISAKVIRDRKVTCFKAIIDDVYERCRKLFRRTCGCGYEYGHVKRT
ncbi:DEGLY-like protein [Mya arenaria]|uniref:DEGLY-like protein n=1 Tax=Mya arenaria TaxID=6604 RepID=A0ABY7EQG7_MYAAR|nr:protein/nucleic acid deglycase 2-like [Mya arenaria]WAR12198.1 DEGLY-like protein [Mya arenaria]